MIYDFHVNTKRRKRNQSFTMDTYNGAKKMCRLGLIKLWIWSYCRRCDLTSSTCLVDGDKLPETEMKVVNFRCKEKDGGFHRERSIGFLLYSWKTVYSLQLKKSFSNFYQFHISMKFVLARQRDQRYHFGWISFESINIPISSLKKMTCLHFRYTLWRSFKL